MVSIEPPRCLCTIPGSRGRLLVVGYLVRYADIPLDVARQLRCRDAHGLATLHAAAGEAARLDRTLTAELPDRPTPHRYERNSHRMAVAMLGTLAGFVAFLLYLIAEHTVLL